MAEQNPFLSGPFAPVEQEITAFDLPVTGHTARRAQRLLPAQRAEPDGPGRPR